MLSQRSLFDGTRPAFPAALDGIRHIDLGGGAWLEHRPALISGHDEIYRTLVRTTTWRQERRLMYEREVDVPRLFAGIPADGPGHPVLFYLQGALCARYGRSLSRISTNWYRDGADSVAPHGDRMGPLVPDTVIAIASFGAPRPFVLRPRGGGAGLDFTLGWGDLLVMGGTCQEGWEHAIPKRPFAEGRVSVMYREVVPGRG